MSDFITDFSAFVQSNQCVIVKAFTSLETLLTADVLTCQRRKSTGRIYTDLSKLMAENTQRQEVCVGKKPTK